MDEPKEVMNLDSMCYEGVLRAIRDGVMLGVNTSPELGRTRRRFEESLSDLPAAHIMKAVSDSLQYSFKASPT